MKLVHGEREYKLTWRDGSVAVGATLFVSGLAASFGWGIVIASVGAALVALPFVRVSG